MSKFLFLLFSFVPLVASHVPDKSDRAYALIVETGAKLLELDLVRENINVQEKSIIAYVKQEHFISSAGKAISALLPLENLAPSFDKAIPAFIVLQESISTTRNKLEVQQALKGLVAMLDAPEIFHAVMPRPHLITSGYQDALNYEPIVEFIDAIRNIVHREFLMHYCDESKNINVTQTLVPGAQFFYQVIKLTIINVFGHHLKEDVIVQEKIYSTEAEESSKKADDWNVLESHVKTRNPKSMLYRAILNDSKEEVKQAVQAGANVNCFTPGLQSPQNDDIPLVIAVVFAKYNAVEELVKCGANVHAISTEDSGQYPRSLRSYKLVQYAVKIGDLRSALSLLKAGAQFTGPISPGAVDTWDGPVLSYAIRFCDEDPEACLQFIQELINRGYSVRGGDWKKNIWYIALSKSELVLNIDKILEIFVKNGASPNDIVIGSHGEQLTPLMLAILNRDAIAAEFLLKAGANINQQANPTGAARSLVTPLSYAMHMCQAMSGEPTWSVESKAVLDVLKNYNAKTAESCCK